MTKAIHPAPVDSTDADAVHRYLLDVATSTLILGLCALPGYVAATAVIDRWGRRRLQLVGYAGMTFSYLVCALALRSATSASPPSAPVFYILYGLSFTCCNLVNVTTYVIPAEIFPTAIRATGHGLSAAAGKLGAAIGGALMPAILAASNQSLFHHHGGQRSHQRHGIPLHRRCHARVAARGHRRWRRRLWQGWRGRWLLVRCCRRLSGCTGLPPSTGTSGCRWAE